MFFGLCIITFLIFNVVLRIYQLTADDNNNINNDNNNDTKNSDSNSDNNNDSNRQLRY